MKAFSFAMIPSYSFRFLLSFASRVEQEAVATTAHLSQQGFNQASTTLTK